MTTQIHAAPDMPAVVMDRSTSDRSLLRIAAVAVPVGIVLEIGNGGLASFQGGSQRLRCGVPGVCRLEYLDDGPYRSILCRTAGRPCTGDTRPISGTPRAVWPALLQSLAESPQSWSRRSSRYRWLSTVSH